jgi:hypothetical protein
MSQVFAYVHAKPNGQVFYVGKGSYHRSVNLANRSAWHNNITAKYGRENILVGRIECSSDEIAYELEKGLIKCFRNMGATLCNKTDGGPGTMGYSGYERTPEVNARQSSILKEYLDKHPDEKERRISRMQNLMSDEAVKERQRVGLIRKNSEESTKRKRSVSAKRQHSDPNMKQNHLSSQRTEAIRELRSKNAKGRKHYTNGVVTKTCIPGTEPEGFYLGRHYVIR